jgi:hypothetical protein
MIPNQWRRTLASFTNRHKAVIVPAHCITKKEIPVSPCMNGRSYEGLSQSGLIAHIANAINLWKEEPGATTANDCKLVIAHAIREYQKLLFPANRGLPATPKARAWMEIGGRAIREHVVPVGCVINALMHFVEPGDPAIARAHVRDILERSSILVWVTKDEHDELSQDCMPNGYSSYPWADVWARYREAEIALPCDPPVTPFKPPTARQLTRVRGR